MHYELVDSLFSATKERRGQGISGSVLLYIGHLFHSIYGIFSIYIYNLKVEIEAYGVCVTECPYMGIYWAYTADIRD